MATDENCELEVEIKRRKRKKRRRSKKRELLEKDGEEEQPSGCV